ncbi:3-keto-5-aminohexanoate cleavage protein [Stappia sp. BW2]|uniref:3-keto-5-aminohexanoate cleavage protein n=1 Tax=Stappia sp. BW2 TaxID=2592622 RepID=UPI0011DEE825|nr:3-keto-5-aminohexanoate cleavage protein [Stappia sp. BW2]TYC72266.1 3-keto-5-aminohexanoate cleavage protein [Stappia sp. BW2]
MTPLFTPPPLPLIMVAPNGARRTKSDHPCLPMTVAETVAAAKACFNAGAGALHAHVRDVSGAHVLDAGLYRELLSEMRVAVPQMQVQITTEAVGKYTPEQQRELVYKVKPAAVSVALREMVPEGEEDQAKAFYNWAVGKACAVQHIVYSADDLDRFFNLVAAGTLARESHQLLFVLGRYAAGQESAPEDLVPFLDKLAERGSGVSLDWAVCAFGHRETECLVEAVRRGGKTRIGFENGLWNRTGDRAKDNADRVNDLVSALKEHSLMPA